MTWINQHTHCHFCDGKGAPNAYVEEAVRQGMLSVGFTCHAPVPWKTDWTMKPERLDEYCQTIRDLDVRSGKALDVFLGLEIDYIPDHDGPETPWGRELDYRIGSIHYAGPSLKESGEPWCIDDSEEEYLTGLKEIYGGKARPAVEAYYLRIREMIEKHQPEIIGHLDVIKKNNVAPGGERPDALCFSEDEDWYRAAVTETLRVAAARGSIVEVNTGGLARGRCRSLYPTDRILRECLELGVRITLNADAHQAHQLTAFFPETARHLKDLGVDILWYLTRDGWRGFAYSEKGLDNGAS